MPKNISKDLEVAILELPEKEKNRLLLRLIAKNDILTEQLHYKLLESEEDLSLRVLDLKDDIESTLNEHSSYPIQFLRQIRKLNALVTRHRRVTGNKYGEVELSVFLLKKSVMADNGFLDILSTRTEKLGVYLVRRMIMTLKYLAKLEKDYHIDFESDVNIILEQMHKKITRIAARELDLPTRLEV